MFLLLVCVFLSLVSRLVINLPLVTSTRSVTRQAELIEFKQCGIYLSKIDKIKQQGTSV